MTPKQIAYWAIGFKVMWVVALTQAAEHAWISAIAVWGYTVLCGSRQPKSIWTVVVAGVFCSLIGDGTLGWLGVVQNPDGTALGFPPLWLVGLWCAFATLLPICFRWLFGRLWLAGSLGAVSGTLSYVSGGKLGALMVSNEGLAWIALEWAIALPLLVWLASRGVENVVETETQEVA